MIENLPSVESSLLLALQSDYLADGYKQDCVHLTQLHYSENQCTGRYEVTKAYPPSDGQFHLSMTTVTNCISQTGIIYAGLLNGLQKKNKEVYVLEYNIRFIRPINEHVFVVTATMRKERRKPHACIYTMSGEVHQGAFNYDVTFLFPTGERV
ncbi:TPA: hypothetical protein JG914_004748 [Enterobacter hormaechei subsp. steigerwaltii]|nr:hypothetical protein [Enterobacter hormaechei subsp. steigerwaltii]